MKTFDFLTRKYGTYSWVLAVVFMILPILLVALVPNFYNSLVQVLFDFMLFGASVWFGISISTKEAEKRATDKWLEKAISSCRELLTMSDTAKEIRQRQGLVCNSLGKIVPGVPSQQQESVENLLDMRCSECKFNIVTIQKHMDNIYQDWSDFVNDNCSETECAGFHSRLDKRKKELKSEYGDLSAIQQISVKLVEPTPKLKTQKRKTNVRKS
jgi:hypothetical protein